MLRPNLWLDITRAVCLIAIQKPSNSGVNNCAVARIDAGRFLLAIPPSCYSFAYDQEPGSPFHDVAGIDGMENVLVIVVDMLTQTKREASLSGTAQNGAAYRLPGTRETVRPTAVEGKARGRSSQRRRHCRHDSKERERRCHEQHQPHCHALSSRL